MQYTRHKTLKLVFLCQPQWYLVFSASCLVPVSSVARITLELEATEWLRRDLLWRE